MPAGLRRIQGGGDQHFITCSCYRRRPLLGSPQRRDLFLNIFEEVRRKYEVAVIGYVVMPEHFHILVWEPKVRPLSVFMQVLKQRVSRACLRQKIAKKSPPAFWEPRYYDFNVYSKKKRIEKLRYIHRNPVTRGLVESPEQWRWSSYRFYRFGEEGPVKIED